MDQEIPGVLQEDRRKYRLDLRSSCPRYCRCGFIRMAPRIPPVAGSNFTSKIQNKSRVSWDKLLLICHQGCRGRLYFSVIGAQIGWRQGQPGRIRRKEDEGPCRRVKRPTFCFFFDFSTGNRGFTDNFNFDESQFM